MHVVAAAGNCQWCGPRSTDSIGVIHRLIRASRDYVWHAVGVQCQAGFSHVAVERILSAERTNDFRCPPCICDGVKLNVLSLGGCNVLIHDLYETIAAGDFCLGSSHPHTVRWTV